MMEYLEPFDKIIAKEKATDPWKLDFFQSKSVCTLTTPKEVTSIPYYNGISGTYVEIHKYESWMRRFIDTDIPYENWKEQNY